MHVILGWKHKRGRKIHDTLVVFFLSCTCDRYRAPSTPKHLVTLHCRRAGWAATIVDCNAAEGSFPKLTQMGNTSIEQLTIEFTKHLQGVLEQSDMPLAALQLRHS